MQHFPTTPFPTALPELSQPWRSASFPDATLAIANDDPWALVAEHDWDFAGGMEGWATAYSGHQFGHFNPVLGDGRALLLGETADGREVQLKGSGPTPFSRGGDGLGTLGSMVREYVVSEVMHAAGIPTTRIAAVFRTGEEIARNGRREPGGIAVRLATSHIRVGTFQFARLLDEHRDEHAVLPALAQYTLQRVVGEPGGRDAEILRHAVQTQAALVAKWMRVGFVHGVMNTDNMSLAGETIDYGPCAFVDTFDPTAKFSSIDAAGRYAFGQQPSIAMWNLARLAEALCGTSVDVEVDEANAILQTFPDLYHDALTQEFGGPLPPDGVDLRRWWRENAAERSTEDAPCNPPRIPRNYEIENAVEAATHGDVNVAAELVASVKEKATDDQKWQDPGPPEEGTGPYVTYCGT